MGRRIMGKAGFAELQDSKGRIQVYVQRDAICPGEDKEMFITTRGMNIPTGSAREQGSTYLQALSSLWGLGEITTVAAWNLDYLSPEEVDEKLADASSLAKAIAVSF